MATNTTGFEFSNDPGSPASDVNAQNLNDAVQNAVIRNIAPKAVKTEHLDYSIAGAGLAGGAGNQLSVRTDNNSIEIVNDALQIKNGGVQTSHIADGAITNDKLADEIQKQLKSVLLGIYDVGDFFITRNATFNPASRFGGQWELLKDKFLIGAGGEYRLSSTGGKKTHTLTVSEMPAHSHYTMADTNATRRVKNKKYLAWSDSGDNGRYNYALTTTDTPTPTMGYTSSVGSSKPHNNMPPYVAVYRWVKISNEDA